MQEQPKSDTKTAPKPPAQQAATHTVQFRRGTKVSKGVPIKQVIPGIKSGKLLGSDEISTDGIKWMRLDKTPHLAKYFQAPVVPEVQADCPKLPDLLMILPEATRGFETYKPREDEVIKSGDNGWILYSRSPFPLTVYGPNQEIAEKLKDCFDALCFPEETDEDTDDEENEELVLEKKRELDKREEAILLIITTCNLRCKEIEEYIKIYKPFYLKKLEEQVKNSGSWELADQVEKSKLLDKFKLESINSFQISYGINLQALFDGEGAKLDGANALVSQYGSALLHFYFERRKKCPYPGVVTVDPDDKDDIRIYDELAKKGLALRGNKIPVTNILEVIDYDPLRLMFYDLQQKGFADKDEAVAFGSKLPDILDRAAKVLQIDFLFQLQPLPVTVESARLHDIIVGFEYAYEMYSLMLLTIMGTSFNLQTYLDGQGRKHPWYVVKDFCCPSCQNTLKDDYPFEACPRLPYHVGCSCYLSLIKIQRVVVEPEAEAEEE